jgi:hypothetical protein
VFEGPFNEEYKSTRYMYVDNSMYLPSHSSLEYDLKYYLDHLVDGIYRISIEIYNGLPGRNDTKLLYSYTPNENYLLEVVGTKSYVQTGNISLNGMRYQLFFIHYVLGSSYNWDEVTVGDIGYSLYKYARAKDIEWLAKLGNGLRLMDHALGPLHVNVTSLYGVDLSILYRNGRGYLVFKSPVELKSMRDIDLDRYILGEYIEFPSMNYIVIPSNIDTENKSYIKIWFESSEKNVVLDVYSGDTHVGPTPNGIELGIEDSAYYRHGNRTIIVLPLKTPDLCIYVNGSKLVSGRSLFKISVYSVRNGKSISGFFRDGYVDAGEVDRLCVDVINGFLRVRIEFKPGYVNINVLMYLATAIIILALVYVLYRRLYRK